MTGDPTPHTPARHDAPSASWWVPLLALLAPRAKALGAAVGGAVVPVLLPLLGAGHYGLSTLWQAAVGAAVPALVTYLFPSNREPQP